MLLGVCRIFSEYSSHNYEKFYRDAVIQRPSFDFQSIGIKHAYPSHEFFWLY